MRERGKDKSDFGKDSTIPIEKFKKRMEWELMEGG